MDISATVSVACGTSPTASDSTFVSNTGLIAGTVNGQAFIYNTQTTEVTCIPNPGPFSVAGAINNLEQVIVSYFDSGYSYQGTIIWSPNAAAINIPTLYGDTRVIGGAINDSGEVVGNVCTVCADVDNRAILFSNGMTYDFEQPDPT